MKSKGRIVEDEIILRDVLDLKRKFRNAGASLVTFSESFARYKQAVQLRMPAHSLLFINEHHVRAKDGAMIALKSAKEALRSYCEKYKDQPFYSVLIGFEERMAGWNYHALKLEVIRDRMSEFANACQELLAHHHIQFSMS